MATRQKKQDKEQISWQAPEFEYQRKDLSWYWLSLIFAIVLIALSIWQKNFLFAVFVVLAWLVIVYSTRRPPTVWNFSIDERGVQIDLPNGDPSSIKFYPFEEINGFDLHEGQNLVLKLKKKLSPYLKINFPAEQEEKIKNFLQKYIPEEEYASSLADSFSKLIKF